jgi:phosphate transport system substrate-binding protein
MHGLLAPSEDPARVPPQERVAQARNGSSTSGTEEHRAGSAGASNEGSGGRAFGGSKPAPAVAPPAPQTASGADSAPGAGRIAATARIATSPRDSMVILTAPSAHDYTRDMAQRFARSGFAEPHVETQIPRDGWSFFCADRSLGGVHVVVRFGRMTAEERRACDDRPSEALVEVKLGYESIVIARSNLYGAFPLTPREVFLALAAEVPDPDNPQRFIENPYSTWSDVDSALPYDPIEVIGPRIDSPLGRALAALMLEAGCNAVPQIAALRDIDEQRHRRMCGTVRNDGAYVEMAEGFDFMLRMETYPTVIGVVSHDFFVTNGDTLDAAPVSGVEPTPAALASGAYAGSRPLYLYVKPTWFGFVPGLFELVYSYHETAPLFGLVAPQEAERQEDRAELLALKPPGP